MIVHLLSVVIDSSTVVSGGITVAALGIAFGVGVVVTAMRARLDRREADAERHHADDIAAFADLERRIERAAEAAAATLRASERAAADERRLIHERYHELRTWTTHNVGELYTRIAVLEDRTGADRTPIPRERPRDRSPAPPPSPAPRRKPDESGG